MPSSGEHCAHHQITPHLKKFARCNRNRHAHTLPKRLARLERFKSILEITTNTEGPLKRADEVEGLLIEEMRRLGKTSMESWAGQTERRLTEQLKAKDSSVNVRKKKD